MRRGAGAIFLCFALTVGVSADALARPTARQLPESGSNAPREDDPARAGDITETFATADPEAETPAPPEDGRRKSEAVVRAQPREAASGASYAAMIGFLIPLLAVLGAMGWVIQRRFAALDRRIAALERDGRRRDPTVTPDAGLSADARPAFAARVPQPASSQLVPDRAPIRSASSLHEPTEAVIAPPVLPPDPLPPQPSDREYRDPPPDPVSARVSTVQSRQRGSGSAGIRDLLDEIARLAASPSLKISDYDATLERFGSVCGVRLDQETFRLVDPDPQVSPRLSAIVLANTNRVVIVPSGRWIKQFDMTYKESLDAGADVSRLFALHPDGSGVPKVERPALAMVADDGYLHSIERGFLVGFVR